MRPPAVGLRVPSGPKRAPWVALAGRRNWPPAHEGDQVPQKIFLGCYQGSRCTRCSPRTVAATWLLRFPVISGSPETALLRERCLIVRDAREHFASLHLQTLALKVPGSPRRSTKRLESCSTDHIWWDPPKLRTLLSLCFDAIPDHVPDRHPVTSTDQGRLRGSHKEQL